MFTGLGGTMLRWGDGGFDHQPDKTMWEFAFAPKVQKHTREVNWRHKVARDYFLS